MSFAEVLAEIPKLTAEQRRELLLQLRAAEEPSADTGSRDFKSERRDGRLVLTSPRMIRQAEVEAILSEFP
jgi:hypothetical protein